MNFLNGNIKVFHSVTVYELFSLEPWVLERKYANQKPLWSNCKIEKKSEIPYFYFVNEGQGRRRSTVVGR